MSREVALYDTFYFCWDVKSLDLKVGIDEYKRIYQFTEPIKMGYNLAANQVYSKEVMHDLEEKILERGM